jgi:hypothetical protein
MERSARGRPAQRQVGIGATSTRMRFCAARRNSGRGSPSACSGRSRSSLSSRLPVSSSATSIRSPIRSSSFSASLLAAPPVPPAAAQLAAKSLAQRVEPAPQLQQRVAQLAAGHGDELRLEAVGVLQAGHVFERGHGAQQPPFESRMGVVRSR